MMFGSFKDKIQSVQENLTTSFRGLRAADNASQNPLHTKKLPVDINAGAELLHKYQSDWHNMHIIAEDNALAAQKVDTQICNLRNKMSSEWEATAQLTASLAALPKLCSSTEQIIVQIGSMASLISSVEEALLELADLVERKDLQVRQLESRFQLAIHSEQRLAKLDKLRAELSEDHRQKVTQFEKEFEKKQKERQETFGKAFEEDLETYKQTGTVPTIRPHTPSGPSLEEVELDVDTTALNKMLEE